MNSAPFRIEPLADQDERASFRCGDVALDRYLHTQATQDIRRRIASCFIAVEQSSGLVAAFYTLSAASVALKDLPTAEAKRLPRYPSVPAVRIGRLAVDQRFQGQGLGSALLLDAVARTIRNDIAAVALLVDAKSESAVEFYRRFGFQTLADQPRSLFLPLATTQRDLKLWE